MVYILQKVCCTTIQSPATTQIISSYIKEFSKQLLKIAMQPIKSLLTFLPTKTIPNFPSSIEPLKQSSLTQNYNGKLKGHTILTIQFPEGITST